ncbi:MAG: helix-turn-helix transcriptional regulator [Alphaproteobacteria bacterium]|jgi:transcriptional regulator with XRE-family HTH domain|nr:helix-turn-helix transcriptional regulator [Alphaproteobacteria bacterium]
MNIGDRIRRFRRARDMTQADLALHLGLTKTGVASWEQGRAEPPLSRLDAIASALGVDVYDIAFGVPRDVAPCQPDPEIMRIAVDRVVALDGAAMGTRTPTELAQLICNTYAILSQNPGMPELVLIDESIRGMILNHEDENQKW